MKKLILSILIIIFFPSLIWGAKAYTPKEVVASTICAEAVGEGQVGLYAVSNVIANRSRAWNKTPYEVVTQKNQFYGYTAENRKKLYVEGKDYCNYLAENLLELDDITNGALFFRKIDEEKKSWHEVFCIKIFNHLYYK